MATTRRESGGTQPGRRGVIAPILLTVALLAAAGAVVFWSISPANTLGNLEHEEESAFSRIRVRRDGDVRAMFASYLYQPQPKRVLIVGLGGGAMVHFLTHHDSQVQIDAVEIDPVVVRLADQYFNVRAGGNVRVHTADAMAFIEATTDRYDLILMDAFLRPSSDTDATGVPTGLKTVAFLNRLRQALAPGGVVAFNINEHEHMTDDIAAVSAAFGHAAVYRCPPSDNKVIIATEGALATDEQLRARSWELDARFGGTLPFAEVLRNRE